MTVTMTVKQAIARWEELNKHYLDQRKKHHFGDNMPEQQSVRYREWARGWYRYIGKEMTKITKPHEEQR